jgi:hypothetical protein
MKRTLVFCALMSLAPFAMQAQQPTPAPAGSQERLELQSALLALTDQIASAKAEDAKYAGGLIKTLIQSRVAILEQTKAMLDQRSKAASFSTSIRYTVDGRLFTAPTDAAQQLASVEAELERMKVQIAGQEREAARYTGGLVQAMALSTLATTRQTQSMIEQKRLALKFGLPQYVGFGNVPQTTAPPASSTQTAAPDPADLFEIVAIDSKVTESNDTWWKFAWRLTLRNKSDRPAVYRAVIGFYDSEGFEVDSATETVALKGGADDTFTGTKLVTTSAARNVRKTGVKVGLER